jgi:hypothetical protein
VKRGNDRTQKIERAMKVASLPLFIQFLA